VKQYKSKNKLQNSFQEELHGDLYINSIESIIEENSKKPSQLDKIGEFLESICENNKKDEFNGTFDEYLTKIKCEKSKRKISKIIHMLGKIGTMFPKLSERTIDALIHIMEEDKENSTCKNAIHEMGRIGHIREGTCNKIIDEINKITHTNMDHDVTVEAIHALYEIGLAWKKKKKIFFPLIDILKRGDKEEKLEAIRAIRTQLEGYWEKPIEALKDLVLYEEDFEVRRVAAMSLGEVGAYTSFSVREAIFELTTNMGHQIQRLKSEYKKNKVNNFHIRCRLSDSKAILKILYHYIRIYKYGYVD
jgi:HEAT repeat protein